MTVAELDVQLQEIREEQFKLKLQRFLGSWSIRIVSRDAPDGRAD